MNFENSGIHPVSILLPTKEICPEQWACVACDQFTSQPEYWDKVEAYVGSSPSTLRIMLPEVWLSESERRTPVIDRTMEKYLADGVLVEAVHEGFVLVERTTASGCRTGLVCAVDLENYDYRKGTTPLIRPTEQTIASRLPARLEIRRNAPLELTHIMILVDDPEDTLFHPLREKKASLHPLYDFDLMMDGGHLNGWAVENEDEISGVLDAVNGLKEKDGDHPFVYAVGDGNHSLATAKAGWEEIRGTLTEEERKNHPARFALCEIVNIHDPALLFEPIHRIMKGIDHQEFRNCWKKWCDTNGQYLTSNAPNDAQRLTLISENTTESTALFGNVRTICCETVQEFLDAYLASHPMAEIDYIHGEEDVRKLCKETGCYGILLPAIDKHGFFDSIRKLGTLPRKTFSMGEAREKRYYMEARIIR